MKVIFRTLRQSLWWLAGERRLRISDQVMTWLRHKASLFRKALRRKRHSISTAIPNPKSAIVVDPPATADGSDMSFDARSRSDDLNQPAVFGFKCSLRSITNV